MITKDELKEMEAVFKEASENVNIQAVSGVMWDHGRLIAEVRERLEADIELIRRLNRPMCAYGCQSPSFLDAAIEGGWTGREDISACMNKTWLEHVKTCPNHPQRKVEAELATWKQVAGDELSRRRALGTQLEAKNTELAAANNKVEELQNLLREASAVLREVAPTAPIRLVINSILA